MMTVGASDCRKGQVTNSPCGARRAEQTCTVTILESVGPRRVSTEWTCRSARSKRQLGAPSQTDVNDPGIQELAKFALAELDKMSASNNRLGLHHVVSAQTQVVAGTKTTLVMAVGDSDCVKGQQTDGPCRANKAEKECTVVIWEQAWLNKREITESSCTAARTKRQLAGGVTQVDPNSANIRQLAQFALAEMDKKTNSQYRLGLQRINSATTQVVAGIRTTITMTVGASDCRKGQATNRPCGAKRAEQTCTVTILQPAGPGRDTAEWTCRSARTKRQLGAPSQTDVNDPGIQELAKFALAELDKMSASNNRLGLHHVVSAQTQVVAGTKTTLVMAVGDSDCVKGQQTDGPCRANKAEKECTVVIWEQAWLNKREITESSCTAARTKRNAVGAPDLVDVNSRAIDELKEFAAGEITHRTNSDRIKVVVRVLEASRQVVSGTITTMKVEVADTDCHKGENKHPSQCRILSTDSQNHQICKIAIWEQAWLNKREVQHSECHNAQAAANRANGEVSNLRLKRMLYSSAAEGGNATKLEEFNRFLQRYSKSYKLEGEYRKRFLIFAANLRKIEYLQKTEQGTAVYGVTRFADLSREEFKRYYTGLKQKKNSSVHATARKMADIPDVRLPVEFDWRDHNVVTPVKDQKMCGSCWAFSVTGNVEGQWAIKNKQLISLSEQELVDCDKYDGGCNGGWFESAFHAIEELGGLEAEKDYPYIARRDTCRFNSSEVEVTISSSVNISSSEVDMAKWLYANGPISIAINANAMQFYLGGVSHPPKFMCDPSPDSLDHGVLIVGYGVHRTSILHRILPYWIVKNSWGPSWGDEGYYLVYRGDGTCGVNQMPTSAVL